MKIPILALFTVIFVVASTKAVYWRCGGNSESEGEDGKNKTINICNSINSTTYKLESATYCDVSSDQTLIDAFRKQCNDTVYQVRSGLDRKVRSMSMGKLCSIYNPFCEEFPPIYYK